MEASSTPTAALQRCLLLLQQLQQSKDQNALVKNLLQVFVLTRPVYEILLLKEEHSKSQSLLTTWSTRLLSLSTSSDASHLARFTAVQLMQLSLNQCTPVVSLFTTTANSNIIVKWLKSWSVSLMQLVQKDIQAPIAMDALGSVFHICAQLIQFSTPTEQNSLTVDASAVEAARHVQAQQLTRLISLTVQNIESNKDSESVLHGWRLLTLLTRDWPNQVRPHFESLSAIVMKRICEEQEPSDQLHEAMIQALISFCQVPLAAAAKRKNEVPLFDSLMQKMILTLTASLNRLFVCMESNIVPVNGNGWYESWDQLLSKDAALDVPHLVRRILGLLSIFRSLLTQSPSFLIHIPIPVWITQCCRIFYAHDRPQLIPNQDRDLFAVVTLFLPLLHQSAHAVVLEMMEKIRIRLLPFRTLFTDIVVHGLTEENKDKKCYFMLAKTCLNVFGLSAFRSLQDVIVAHCMQLHQHHSPELWQLLLVILSSFGQNLSREILNSLERQLLVLALPFITPLQSGKPISSTPSRLDLYQCLVAAVQQTHQPAFMAHVIHLLQRGLHDPDAKVRMICHQSFITVLDGLLHPRGVALMPRMAQGDESIQDLTRTRTNVDVGVQIDIEQLAAPESLKRPGSPLLNVQEKKTKVDWKTTDLEPLKNTDKALVASMPISVSAKPFLAHTPLSLPKPIISSKDANATLSVKDSSRVISLPPPPPVRVMAESSSSDSDTDPDDSFSIVADDPDEEDLL